MARTATVAPAAPGEPEAGSAGGPEETSRAARLAAPLWPAALAAGTVWLGFDAGGYFADTTGWAAAAVAVALAVSALALGRPPLGPTGATALAGGALAALAVWTLASGLWSDSMARALVEFDRVLLYLLVLLLFAAAPAPGVTLKRLPPAFLLAAIVLCGAGLVVRLLPDAWPFALPPANARMDYPLTYENALGAFAAVAIVFALHLASSAAERAPVRVLAAGALPLLVATLVLTFSRGGIAAAVVGALAYVLIAPSRGLLGTLLAAGAPVAVAAAGAHGAELLASDRPRSAAAMAQGEELAALLAVAVLAAAALRALLLVPERRLPPLRPSRRALGAATAALVAAAAVALGVAAAGDVPSRVVDRIVSQRQAEGRLTRSRLTDTRLRAQTRPGYWRVAIDAFERDRLAGAGAGTFPLLWARDRPTTETVEEGHSLYLETLAELGLVGVALLAAALVAMLWPFVVRVRRPPGGVHAGVLAAAIAWLAHAGIDWDWEMPALTVWPFAVAGCALAATGRPLLRRPPRALERAAVAVACLLTAATPATVAVSQTRLDSSVLALGRGDCAAAVRSARASISALGVRPEPHAVLAVCRARAGRRAAAVAGMQLAVDRDPHNWEYRYGLALVRALAGLDPRPAARAALALNPREPLAQEAASRFDTSRRALWARRAADLPLPFRVELR